MKLGDLSRGLFRTADGLGIEDQRDAGMLIRISFIYVLFLFLMTVAISGLAGGPWDTTGLWTNGICVVVTLAAHLIARTKYFRFGSWMLVAGVLFGIGVSVVRVDIPDFLSLIFLPVAILLSSLTQRIEETLALSGACLLVLLAYLVSLPPNRHLQVVFLMVLVVATLILVFQYQRRKDLKALLYERAKALAASRMAELGQVAGGVAHEVNNPLSIILGSCQQARDHLLTSPLNPQLLGDRLERIDRMGYRIDRIVKALRNMARQGDDEPMALVPASALLETVADLCAHGLKKGGLTLRWSGAISVRVLCWRVQVEQILINLVDNACDAITIRSGTIQIDVLEDSEWVVFVVSDSGPGVPEDIREQVFMPFFTTKKGDRGTGLGLSISAGLAHAHGGELILEGHAPQSRFCLKLPRSS